MKKIFISLLILLLAVGCSPKEEVEVNEATQITLAEFLDKVNNNDTFAIIFEQDSCPWCIEALPVFKDITEKNTAESYYINFTDAAKEATYDTDFTVLLNYLKDYIAEEDGEPVFYIPHAFFFKNGEIMYDHVGTVDSHNPNVAKMTDAQVEELSGYYQSGFDAIQ
ncbi:MAG: hypothetical protein VB012_03970 [Erysipelotrichaceae bacterium]|nr:hypothetical protein [Erysipelotrichaceae bacterium]